MLLWMNSKRIKKGDYFLVNKENEKYVKDAIKNGAVKIISELKNKYEIDTVFVDSVKEYLHDFYWDKIKDLTFIGITGTNGKTTTCYLIYQILNMLKVKTAYVGTIGFYVSKEVFLLDNTTPTMDLLYSLILEALNKECEVVVMEVSSHALKQDRVYGLLFDAIGVTNITQDHLDYHKTIDDYVQSKQKLIKMTRNKKICILNKKDKYYKRFLSDANDNLIIGKHVKITSIVNYMDGISMVINDGIKRGFLLSMVGDFNVYNFLYAYYIIKKLGYEIDKIKNNFYMLEEPPGRMQKINYKKNVIFIDYAHTPDAVLNVLKTVGKIKNNGIITIIGCGGNRDKGKRPLMAKVACKRSSQVIFTNDNPRDEDEVKIMKDILKGASGKFYVVYDRFEAIKKGINLLDENMILMILGKGHECYQIIGSEKKYFSDEQTVKDILSEIEIDNE